MIRGDERVLWPGPRIQGPEASLVLFLWNWLLWWLRPVALHGFPRLNHKKLAFPFIVVDLPKNLDLAKYPLNAWIDEQTGFQRPTGVGTIDSLWLHSGLPCTLCNLCMAQRSLVRGLWRLKCRLEEGMLSAQRSD